MKLLYTRPAARDLAQILDYLAQRSPQGAKKVQSRIRAITDLLLQYPYVGQPTRRPGMRRLVVTPYPYLIFYRPGREAIVIHAVRHAARSPASMPGRGQS